MVQLAWASATDTGRAREINEDSLLIESGTNLFAVADGMGGHAAGEVASRIAVETLKARFEPSVDGIVAAIKAANREVLARANEEPSWRGMGTTLSVVALVPTDDGEEVLVANVGDSRVYRVHDGDLEQLSEDHSLVQDFVREGRISAAEARVHPNRNVVTRTIGNDPDVDVDWWMLDPAAGDRYLICSDGLSDELEDAQIARVLLTTRDPNEAARALVSQANQAGGRDNITVVIVDVVDDGGRSESASKTVARETRRSEPMHRETSIAERSLARGDDTVAVAAVRHRRFTWRVVAFLVALVVVLGAAVGGLAWFARNTYYVGVDASDQVTVFRGRPGGLLIWDPTVEDRTPYDIADIERSRQDEVRAGHETATRAEADRYVDNITTTTTTTTSTTTTSTTTPAAPTTSTP
jgi:protein phosphatase